MTKPLQGITVVAVEQAVAAPLATARLADAGARVIKVERAEGDFARGYDRAAGGDSSYFAWTNHGKESIALDIKAADDAALLHRIIGSSDVFVQNLAPGALVRAGFGSDELRAQNPRLITCDVSGYGEDPAVAEKKAYDLLVQAESGLVGISGGANELGRIGVSICDIGAGMTTHAAVLEALISRSITGKGSAIRISLFDVAAEWMTVPLVQHEYDGKGPTRVGLMHPSIAPYGAYQTADGALTLISIQNEREWERLCRDVLGRPELAVDSRFGSNNDRVANRDALEAELSSSIAQLDRATFEGRLTTASLAFGAVNTLAELGSHLALRRRPIVSTEGVTVDFPAHPVRRDITVDSEPRVTPHIGEHTDAIREEFAG